MTIQWRGFYGRYRAVSMARHARPKTVTESAVIEDRGPENSAPDWLVPTLHDVGLMTVMRVSEAIIWPDPFARTQWFGAKYEDTFTKPPLFPDGDPILVNVGGHALFGSELYLRARQCRFGWAGSLAFAAAASVVWEYAFEGSGVRPSAFDMVYTPMSGILFGELRHIAWRSSSPGSPIRWIVDPLGQGERALGSGC
jgi:hypothetical protein